LEFQAPAGERAIPLCCVARDVLSGEIVRHWLADDVTCALPFEAGPDSLFIAYYASAEWGNFLALDWPLPVRVIDLYVEFRNATAGLTVPCGYGLLGALAYYGLDGIAPADKEGKRALAIRGGPYSEDERLALLDFCQSDVDALTDLLPVMLPTIDFP